MELKNLKKVCGETKELQGKYGPYHLQLVFDKSTGELFTHECWGHGSYAEYADSDIITIGHIFDPMTMEEIKSLVSEKLEERSKWCNDGRN